MSSYYSEEHKYILNHPYTKSLLETTKYEVSHPYDVDEERKAYSLTSGALQGQDLVAHTPVTLKLKDSIIEESNTSQIHVFYNLGSRLCGHEGIIHGGLLATLLDESLCRCGFPLLPNKVGVTGSLNIKYLAPTPANSYVVLSATTTELKGRKVTVYGSISILGDLEPQHKTVEAEALVIEPRWASKLNAPRFADKSAVEVKLVKDDNAPISNCAKSSDRENITETVTELVNA